VHLYHITSADEWTSAARTGIYAPTRFDAEGFIHCSYASQVRATANRLFAGRSDLVLLEIDREQLSCAVVDENLEGGSEQYPHVYGRLPTAAVAAVHSFRCDRAGRFDLPASVVQQA